MYKFTFADAHPIPPNKYRRTNFSDVAIISCPKCSRYMSVSHKHIFERRDRSAIIKFVECPRNCDFWGDIELIEFYKESDL